jgi:simple sugar transport system substrate-binding protein
VREQPRQGRRHYHHQPRPGNLIEIVKARRRKSDHRFNTPDRSGLLAYVGGDNVTFGKHWAQYLVDKGW